MLYKHLFSILCGHFNLNQKRKKNWIWPITSQTGRYTGTNRLNWEVWIQIWICPVPTGNRPNRSGIPEPEAGGYRLAVGKLNPDRGRATTSALTRRCRHAPGPLGLDGACRIAEHGAAILSALGVSVTIQCAGLCYPVRVPRPVLGVLTHR